MGIAEKQIKALIKTSLFIGALGCKAFFSLGSGCCGLRFATAPKIQAGLNPSHPAAFRQQECYAAFTIAVSPNTMLV